LGESLERELAEEIRRALASGSVLEVLAAVNTFLEERNLGRLIIVGGFAVEIYSGGAYRTGDVDVVVEGAADLLRRALGLLEEWRSRVWVYRGLEYAIDVVSRSYGRPKAPVRLTVDGKAVYVEPPEESVVSCLNACVYWQSDLDCEKAAMVMAAQWDRLDWEYLERRSREEGTLAKLEELRRQVERVVEERER